MITLFYIILNNSINIKIYSIFTRIKMSVRKIFKIMDILFEKIIKTNLSVINSEEKKKLIFRILIYFHSFFFEKKINIFQKKYLLKTEKSFIFLKNKKISFEKFDKKYLSNLLKSYSKNSSIILFFKKNTIINSTYHLLFKNFLFWKINKEKRNKFYRLLYFLTSKKILLLHVNSFRKRIKIKNSIFDNKNTKSFKKIFQKDLILITKNCCKKNHKEKKCDRFKVKSTFFSNIFDNYMYYNKNSNQKILFFQKKGKLIL